MRLKVIFLKKRHILFILLIILIAVLAAFLLFSQDSTPSSSIAVNDKIINKYDFNGDGTKDITYIKTVQNKYILQVNINKNSFYLEPNKPLDTLGTYYQYWPIRVSIVDVSRNKIPEIFTQASENGSPIQHLFIWDKDGFKNILSNNNNLLGFIDLHNNKTPKILSGFLNKDSIHMNNYILVNNKLKQYQFNYSNNFAGKDTIVTFVNYIQSLPYNEVNKPEEIFYPGLNGKALSAIGKLTGEDNIYTFQDGVFMDKKCDSDGNELVVQWTLNFKGVSNKVKDKTRYYTINVLLQAYGDANSPNHFKINSISLTNN
ncbi:MAG: VCBS repeat-containing protein [Bacillota bacterium]|nr:VCBS repeat-containing protein [Bacillota bacterium]